MNLHHDIPELMQSSLNADLTHCKSDQQVTRECQRASSSSVVIRCNFSSSFPLDYVVVGDDLHTKKQIKMRWLLTMPVYPPPPLTVILPSLW